MTPPRGISLRETPKGRRAACCTAFDRLAIRLPLETTAATTRTKQLSHRQNPVELTADFLPKPRSRVATSRGTLLLSESRSPPQQHPSIGSPYWPDMHIAFFRSFLRHLPRLNVSKKALGWNSRLIPESFERSAGARPKGATGSAETSRRSCEIGSRILWQRHL